MSRRDPPGRKPRRVTRERLFPREAALVGLPLQAKLLGRISLGPMRADDLRDLFVTNGVLAKDDPDVTHAVFSQGW